MYLGWAAYYEGASDAAYFDVLIPRVLDDILLREGTRPITVPEGPALRLGVRSRQVDHVAAEICEGRDAFHLLFVHADTGGRALAVNIASRREAFAQAAYDLCGWPLDRTVQISPRHESEAWALADPGAICRALGYTGDKGPLGFPVTPRAAEKLPNPKAELDRIVQQVSGRRHKGTGGLLTSVAREQSLSTLRRARSFQSFEEELRSSLTTLGCLPLN